VSAKSTGLRIARTKALTVGTKPARTLRKSTMSDTYTTTQLLADVLIIRRLAGEVLNPDKIQHKYVYQEDCGKCGVLCWDRINGGRALPALKVPCIPDPAEGSLSDIAELLVKKVMEKMGITIFLFTVRTYLHPSWDGYRAEACWFAFDATPAEKCVCCLLALLPEKVRIGE
jgi:hypothetical protein